MNEKLKIGILLDSFKVTAWEFTMIEKIVNSDYAAIELIVINENSTAYKSNGERLRQNLHKLIYFIYNKIDEKIFKGQPDASALKNLKELLPDTPTIAVKPIQKKFSDFFSNEDINKIEKNKLDIFVRMGFRILKGDILTVSKFGVWSYHHGDNRINRGGPPGLWEVTENQPETGSILQILNEDLDNGQVIYRSWSSTYQLSPAKTKNIICWKSLSFLPRKIEELQRIGEDKFYAEISTFNKDIDFYSHRLYKAPSNLEALKLIFNVIVKIIHRSLQKLFYFDQWILFFDIKKDISKSLWRYKQIIPPKDRFWADPHVILKNSIYYVFIEEFIYKTMKGHISVIEIDGNGSVKKPMKVLDKAYHLSYPHIFEWEKRFYMIPESSANRTIEMYECVDFPHEWKFKMNLMKDVDASDTTLFFYNNKWWLFTAIMENKGASCDDELFLFYSDNLFSADWKSHPMNPIVSDVRKARPAGKLFERQGRIYRPSQDCSKIYGYAIKINEVTILTESEYREETVSSIKPDWQKIIIGTHTFSHEGRLTIVDAVVRNRKFFRKH